LARYQLSAFSNLLTSLLANVKFLIGLKQIHLPLFSLMVF